jgi:hypothetical protein
MPRNESVLTVFVASPADVSDERAKLEEVILELNNTWSREYGVRLDLVRWETHAYPGIGVDAQDVINSQIPDDADIFIGIMWCRYGTPTKRFDSGTIEEFEKAKARHDAAPNSVKMMLYFKDAPIHPSKLDPEHLIKVNQFRDSLGAEGVLYWKFQALEDFEKLLRVHLGRQVQAIAKTVSNPGTLARPVSSSAPATSTTNKPDSVEPEEEPGMIDLLDEFEASFAQMNEVMAKMTQATDELGQRMVQRTQELNDAPRDNNGSVDRKLVKRLVSRAAGDLNHYADVIEADLPLFGSVSARGINTIIKIAPLSAAYPNEKDRPEEARQTLRALLESMQFAKENMSSFRKTFASMPPMTAELNTAKRRATAALDKLLEVFDTNETLMREADRAITQGFHLDEPS